MLAAFMSQNCFGRAGCGDMAATEKKITVEQLFKDFSKQKQATHVKINGFVMAISNLFADTKGVMGIEVYSFDECDSEVKDNFNEAVKNLNDNSYEMLISTSEGKQRTKILMKVKKDYINEIVVIAGGDDPALIRIKGKIKTDDVQSVIGNNK
jgi:hypothetical protein